MLPYRMGYKWCSTCNKAIAPENQLTHEIVVNGFVYYKKTCKLCGKHYPLRNKARKQ
jgi:hypothetical protein